MSQKVSHYLSIGNKEANAIFKGNMKRYLMYVLFLIMSLVGKMFFLSFPLFALADFNLAKQAENNNSIDFEEAFEDSAITNRYWTTVQYALISLIVSIIGFISFAIIAFGVIYFGYFIDNLLDLERYYFAFASQLFSGLVLLVFLIQKSLYFGPVLYLLHANEEYSLSDALKERAKIMSPNSKIQLFKTHTYFVLRLLIQVAIGVMISYIIGLYFINVVAIFIGIFVLVLILTNSVKIKFAHKLSTVKLYNDLVSRSNYLSLSENTSNEDAKLSKSEILLAMFDDIAFEENSDVNESDEKNTEPEKKLEVEGI